MPIDPEHRPVSPLDHLVRSCLHNRLVVMVVTLLVIFWGLYVAPFDWHLGGMPRDPVPVDAIPDIGENQQIVFTEWMGRSPQDVEDQISYPLTVSLLGVPGVKSIRSYSMFGFSTIYVIFNEEMDFYWARSRLLEKLNSLAPGALPPDVQPVLGPDATALGQIYWYTLEGRDQDGNVTGGWSLQELRSIQDWTVRYALMAVAGVSEVASVGGFVKEYQVDVDPHALRIYDISIEDVFRAVRMSNLDVGARTIELNQAEYIVRGVGFIRSVEDLEQAVVAVHDNSPVRLRDVAQVALGPALRRGALDRGGVETVGGVVVARFGENPLAVLNRLHDRIGEVAPGLPEKVIVDFDRATPGQVRAFAQRHGFDAFNNDGTLNRPAWLQWARRTAPERYPGWLTWSKVRIVPFYDRSGLIRETLATLNTALVRQVLVTIVVILIMVRIMSASLLISGLMPLAILITFVAMKYTGVDANVVALSGIAIAIGTMVDMGIVITENIIRHRREDTEGLSPVTLVYRATREVAGAILTAVTTTVVGFMPVFALQAAEGKLFRPLAYTKTFALMAAMVVAVTVLPVLASFLIARKPVSNDWKNRVPHFPMIGKMLRRSVPVLAVLLVVILLTIDWLPLGPERGLTRNLIFVGVMVAGLLLVFALFRAFYTRMLAWCLVHKRLFTMLPLAVVAFGLLVWTGWGPLFRALPRPVRELKPVVWLAHALPGLDREFMPHLDEGAFITMPTTMPHASIGQALDMLRRMDAAIAALPEVESSVGKLGRAESPLDPAPISMFEVLINYRPQFLQDSRGRRRRFKYRADEVDWFRDVGGDPVAAPDGQPYRVQGTFVRDEQGRLIADAAGAPFRLWRPALDPALNPGRKGWPGIQSPADIWEQIVRVTRIPGVTSSPRLQPIETRIVMLQSGMRAPMGVKIKGPDLESVETTAMAIEEILKQVPSVRPETVLADRIIGKPYLEIQIDRDAIARYGLHVQNVQRIIETAVGGKPLTYTVEGRARYPVRVRYMRELRDDPEALERLLVPTPTGAQVPLGQLAAIHYQRGPQVIKSEDTFLVGYVTFDKVRGAGEVDVIEQCRAALEARMASGELPVPAGVSFSFAGTYENQVRAARTLSMVIPVALIIIGLILYLQFKSVRVTLLVFSGIFVAWAGGFILIWLYGQSGFLDMAVFGVNLRDVFQVRAYNLSVAVWVGFLALFGIATDNGVLIAATLNQRYREGRTQSVADIRKRTVEAAALRIRPALMTSATTILALLPVLTATGRGADIMAPMAIPTFGGMLIALLTVFVVPVLYCALQEHDFTSGKQSVASRSDA